MHGQTDNFNYFVIFVAKNPILLLFLLLLFLFMLLLLLFVILVALVVVAFIVVILVIVVKIIRNLFFYFICPGITYMYGQIELALAKL